MTLTEIIARLEEAVNTASPGEHEHLDHVLRTHARTLIAAGKVAVEAKGLSFGEDWNNGTHANLHGYRQRLLAALAELDAAMKEPT